MSKDIGFCSITEDLCEKDGKCEDCSLKHIHENLERYAKLHEENRLIVLPDDRLYELRSLILDVNTTEIGNQIADDKLSSWIYSWREAAEKLIRDLYTHDREINVSELAELKGTEE